MAAAQAGPAGVVVPKVNSADEVRSLVAALEKAGAPDHTRLWAMVETPEAIFNVRELAAASDRLAVLVMGTNDLVKELYAEHVPGRAPLLTALSLSLLAARAAGVVILDGVYNDVKDTDGFLAECQPGPRAGLRRQDADPPGPGRRRQRGVRAERAGRRGRPRHPPGLGGRPGLRRRHLQRQDGREPARRVGEADPHHRRRHRCASPLRASTDPPAPGFGALRPVVHLSRPTWEEVMTWLFLV